jgi:hypothetical protein
MGAGTVAGGLALPLRRSFAEPEIKEYRLTTKQAVVNLTGDGHPDTAVWALLTAPCPARNSGSAKAIHSGWW